MIGYACKYTPLELIRAFGGNPVPINESVDSFETADRICPGNLCSYSRALVETIYTRGIKELFLVNCCDSIRRCYDILLADGKLDFIFLMDLPHCENYCAQNRLRSELLRFYVEYGAYRGAGFDPVEFQSAFSPLFTLPEEPFVAITGARIPDNMLATLNEELPYQILDTTCCGNRQVDKVPSQLSGFDASAYAVELLAQIPCMRMEMPRELSELFGHPNLAGIIYHTVAFCDYYSFEYEQLRKNTKSPLLKLESDYHTGTDGQLRTRLQAFSEGLGYRAVPCKKENAMGKYVAGIDSGSTTTNITVLDFSKNLCGSATVRTGPKAAIGAQKALDAVLAQMGIDVSELAYMVATGYGRENIEFVDGAMTEISCHAQGAYHLYPEARTIIDIGGQDSKVIRLNDSGSIESFVMNDKCAAGTGRFLEMMAHTLELDMGVMSTKGLSWQKELTISSVCTVFAESEVISLIADNHTEQDIIHGLNLAVAGKTCSLVHRAGGSPPYMMTGGVARNLGLVETLKQKLGEPVWIAPDPDLCGAIGAALFALDAVLDS